MQHGCLPFLYTSLLILDSISITCNTGASLSYTHLYCIASKLKPGIRANLVITHVLRGEDPGSCNKLFCRRNCSSICSLVTKVVNPLCPSSYGLGSTFCS